MRKDYKALAFDIVRLVGGKENVNSLHHCQTRLRFQLKNDSRADKDAIGKLEGVSRVLINGGMFQVVIGMDVAEAYEEVVKLIGSEGAAGAGVSVGETAVGAGTSGDGEAGAGITGEGASGSDAAKKHSAFDIVTDFISSIFSLIVPALAGAGMVKALLAFTIARKLKCNQILAAVTAGIMCHATWAGLVSAGEAVTFFGIPFYLVRYTGSVIPIVLVILVQARVEKVLNRVIPGAIRLAFAPMLTFIIMGTLAFSILGPFGDYVGMIFTRIFTWLSENVGWLELGVLGGSYSILVIFGLHHGLAPLGTMQMAQMGYDGIFGPAVLCANIGQGTASLITGLLSKDLKTKQIGTTAGITGLMGTTEPALYGINVPKKYPLVAGAIGGGFGGLYAGLTHTHRFATGSSGLPAVVMYIGDGTMQFFYSIVIALGITVVVSAIATVILFKRMDGKAGSDTAAGHAAAPTEIVKSPLTGTAVPLEQVPDEAFACGALGQGIAIDPAEGRVIAPCDGTVVALFPTCHAIGIKSEDGAEILIHIGIDTVNLNGQYFTGRVEQGAQVKAGDTLIEFEPEKIREAGYQLHTMVIISNTGEYQKVEALASGQVETGDDLLRLKKKEG